ncbi:MAG: cadherin-like domain-containing protein, partial [Verrucomicrobiales bacterium]
TVSDGALNDGPHPAAITFSNSNDAPQIATNALTIGEGGTVILSAADLLADDPDTSDAELLFTATGIAGGQFLLGGSLATTFTQEQIIAGAVSFQHDGGELAPAYSITVSDGALNDGPDAATITFTNVNDSPQIAANALTIAEGEAAIIVNLMAADSDNSDAELVFTASAIAHGQFLVGGTPATTFTQAQVLAGQVSFQHDGGEIAPAYLIEASDGEFSDGPDAAAINFNNQKSPPTLIANELAIAEGATVIVKASNLAAADPDTASADLVFTASDVTHGEFLVGGAPTLTFTQAQVVSGEVSFQHDGGEVAPSFTIVVSDGILADGPSAAAIAFANVNDAPVIAANSLTIAEGETAIVLNLFASDPDTADADLAFTASDVAHGGFLVAGSPTLTFTQAQVLAGEVSFQHDGGEVAPSYSIEVSDGALSDGPSAAAIAFTNTNDAPVIVARSLVIAEGETLGLSAAQISAADPDGADADLIFTPSVVTHGQFLVGGSPAATFTQAQILAGEVSFQHDGGEDMPSFRLAVSDGDLADGPIVDCGDRDSPTSTTRQ